VESRDVHNKKTAGLSEKAIFMVIGIIALGHRIDR
jgi:hypothetical protein